MNKNTIPTTWRMGTLEDVVTDKQYSITGGPFGSDLQTKDYKSEGIQIIQLQNIGDGHFINESKVYTSEEKANQLKSCNIYPMDIILAKMADPVARACIVPKHAKRFLMASDGIRVEVDRTKNDVHFVVTAINYSIFRKQAINKSTGTTRARIGLTELKNIRFPIPPFCKQKKIARILTTVDNIVEETEAAVAKYKAIKQGMMHDLFTRGIDVKTGKLRPAFDDAPELYKASELGMIPKEWNVYPCEEVCSEISVGIVIKPSQYYVSAGIPTLRSANVREDKIEVTEMTYISASSNQILFKSQIREGNILTVRTGYPGTSSVVPKEYDGANCIDMVISRPNSEMNSVFLCKWINSNFGKVQVLKKQGGLAQQHFNVGEMKLLLVIKPSKIEQQSIVDRLEALDSLIKSERNNWEKLQQLKQGLMQDLLTGKKEVPPARKTLIVNSQ